MHHCSGCTHGTHTAAGSDRRTGHRGNDRGPRDVLLIGVLNRDMVQAAHGRAPAVATGIKRVHPDNVVFTYQGDGDLAAIGTAEIIHAANRGEKITTIFINNAIYGMTSGQMAPTTLIGQVTTTSPFGRKPEIDGYPLNVCEMLSTLKGAAFVERVSTHDIKNIRNAKKAIRKAFQVQIAGLGFSIVEVLSSCPTNWGVDPVKALKWIEEDDTTTRSATSGAGNWRCSIWRRQI